MEPIKNGKKTSKIIKSARKEGRTVLTEYESKNILDNFDIPVTETILATNKLKAVRAARNLKYPVVMKISSPDIIHKSDAGGVNVGLTSEIEVRQAYENITENAKAYNRSADIQGVVVQKYVPDAREVVIGITQDRSFGSTAMFGLGGVWVEVLEDVSFRLAPVSEKDAEEMIKEINGYPILSGARGEAPSDISALVNIIQKMSKLPTKYEEISEVDLNPVFALDKGKGATVIDAQIILKETEEEEKE